VPSVPLHCWLGVRKDIRPVKTEGWGSVCGKVQMMPLPLTVSCFSKIQTGFTFLVLAHLGNPGQSPEGRKTDVCDEACQNLHLFNANFNFQNSFKREFECHFNSLQLEVSISCTAPNKRTEPTKYAFSYAKCTFG